jgi:hypothetical protein
MSRPIAHNRTSEPINGSIVNGDDVGNIVYTVDGRGNDYYNGYADRTWVPSADGAAPIVFVTDTFTQGIDGDAATAVPMFFACAGTSSAAVIYTANRLPGMSGQDFTTIGEALDYVTRNGYFILEGNDPFEGINADSLALDLDAAKMSSYPQTGTTWYDLSGNQSSGTLTNGPTWNSNGWVTFDGVDDQVSANNVPVSYLSSSTVEVIFSVGGYSGTGKFALAGYNFTGGGFSSATTGMLYTYQTGVIAGSVITTAEVYVEVASSTTVTPGRYYYAALYKDTTNGVLRLYVNGNLESTNNFNTTTYAQWPTPGNFIGNNNFAVGWYNSNNWGSGPYFSGSVVSTKLYGKLLTQAEVKQNYFGSPIVTDGLVFAVDANNIVSYPKSGTAWYNLTGSFSGSLTNGPTFDPANGGAISFDGTDEYVTVQYNSALDISTAITVEAWVKYRSQGEIGGAGRTYSVISYKGYPWTWLLEDQGGQFNFRISTTSVSDSDIASNYYHGLNNWDHVVCTYNGATQAIYVNGILQNSKSLTGTIDTSATTIELGTYGTGDYSLNGWLANHRIYNRALSAAEIQQNYQAEQYRFETPQGLVTNGLVLYWDAGNLDSYPGTGTTIYDLSGNGNNGSLVNGVGYNQNNGGVLTFDGVDDVVRLLAPDLRSTNNTVMGAARYTGSPRGRMINAYGNNWLMGHWNNSTENYYAEGWVSTPGVGASDTNWRIYAALGNVSGDSYSLYVNNSLSAGPSNGGAEGPYGISIGAQGGSPGSEPSTGEFSFVLVYNRVLTTAEMTQNYNYFKGRFGL